MQHELLSKIDALGRDLEPRNLHRPTKRFVWTIGFMLGFAISYLLWG